MITRTKSGGILLDGRKVDMYQLGHWLVTRELETGVRIRFSQVTLDILLMAVSEYPSMLAKHK